MSGSIIEDVPAQPTTRRLGHDKPAGRVPLALKLGYTAFMAVLVPIYWWYYGPTNFLYFCDLALILTLAGVWTESALLVSMCAVGILAPQILWVVDFAATAIGWPLTGMTAYMFKAENSPLLRGLSLFHGWLPFLLVFLVWRLGYDRRAWAAWSALAVAVLFVCFLFMPAPSPDAGLMPVNINYVWGMDDAAAQTLMPSYAWFLLLVLGIPLLLCGPTHLVLRRFAPRAAMPASGGRLRFRRLSSVAPAEPATP